MTPGQRVAASAVDMTPAVHGATRAKPKKPKTRHAAVASHIRTPVLVSLRRIERNLLADRVMLADWDLMGSNARRRKGWLTFARTPPRPRAGHCHNWVCPRGFFFRVRSREGRMIGERLLRRHPRISFTCAIGHRIDSKPIKSA